MRKIIFALAIAGACFVLSNVQAQERSSFVYIGQQQSEGCTGGNETEEGIAKKAAEYKLPAPVRMDGERFKKYRDFINNFAQRTIFDESVTHFLIIDLPDGGAIVVAMGGACSIGALRVPASIHEAAMHAANS